MAHLPANTLQTHVHPWLCFKHAHLPSGTSFSMYTHGRVLVCKVVEMTRHPFHAINMLNKKKSMCTRSKPWCALDFMAMAAGSICGRFCLVAARVPAASIPRLKTANLSRQGRNVLWRSISALSSPEFYSKASRGACTQTTLEQTNETTTITKQEHMESFDTWKIKMLYDGDCPLCMREVNMLRERNKLYGTIKFIDISSSEYSAEENAGLDYKTVMGQIHAILRDGTVLTDIAAFRRLYEEVGLGWVYAITKYEPIATIANAIYGVWAKYRLQITGRPPLVQILEAREQRKTDICSGEGRCRVQ